MKFMLVSKIAFDCVNAMLSRCIVTYTRRVLSFSCSFFVCFFLLFSLLFLRSWIHFGSIHTSSNDILSIARHPTITVTRLIPLFSPSPFSLSSSFFRVLLCVFVFVCVSLPHTIILAHILNIHFPKYRERRVTKRSPTFTSARTGLAMFVCGLTSPARRR